MLSCISDFDMNKMWHKLSILCNVFVGYLLKIKYDLFLIDMKQQNKKQTVDLIVSLTSYGRRVSDNVVYYTILSILNQTVLPKRVILWLDCDNWNSRNIPKKISRLLSFGVDIRYCKDLYSYKKIIPALKAFPEEVILTIDDDVIYPKSFISDFWNAHLNYPNRICASCMSRPIFSNGNLLPYNSWVDSAYGVCAPIEIPKGVGGVLYPVGALNGEVLNESVFLKLAKDADDIWLWIMAIKNMTPKYKIKMRGNLYSFDALYQYFHHGAALNHSNVKCFKNDVQIKALIDYYNIDMENISNVKY